MAIQNFYFIIAKEANLPGWVVFRRNGSPMHELTHKFYFLTFISDYRLIK